MHEVNSSWIKEEKICNFLVTSERKRIWAHLIELFEEFRGVCEKYNLRYCAIAGTMLGAVRHKGFIPWDDDLDVAMPIEDYNILCEIAIKEFTHPLFFQNYITEPGMGPWHAKLRNSNTTGCTKWEAENCPTWNRGIFIDIFPLNHIPSYDNELAKLRKKLLYLKDCINGWEQIRNGKIHKRGCATYFGRRQLMFLMSFKSHTDLCEKYNQIINSVDSESNRIGLLSSFPSMNRFIFDKTWFEELIEVPFEYTTIMIPKKSDECLRRMYGDYMKLVKGEEIHSELTVNLDMPYKTYFEVINEK